MKVTILGGGLAGLSCSYHFGHDNCIVFEAKSHPGGHIYSHLIDGCTWDEGPHISFTKSNYVRQLFEDSTEGEILEYESVIGNWFHGNWIPHPAQMNLYAVPQPLSGRCLDDFLAKRNDNVTSQPAHYGEWLEQAFGETFTHEFAARYTRKYWTCEPRQLGTDWIGNRVLYPDIESVKNGYHNAPKKTSNYISKVRYPTRGGFYKFAKSIKQDANIVLNKPVNRISLRERTIYFEDNTKHRYEYLINTMPLSDFIGMVEESDVNILKAASALSCTTALLVNISGTCKAPLPYHWLYVYNEDYFSTRITQNHLLSPHNMAQGRIGLQVEVYGSKYRKLPANLHGITTKVSNEVKEMGLIDSIENMHTQSIKYANIIFDHQRREALDQILGWLTTYGLKRSDDDLDPMGDWDKPHQRQLGDINMAGRFGEWKYHWSDDCILRGKQLAELQT